jgi:transposase
MKALPVQTVYDATTLLRQGKSVRQVSKALHISTFLVSNFRQKDKEKIPHPKLGRPSKVTKRTKTLLARKFNTGKLFNSHRRTAPRPSGSGGSYPCRQRPKLLETRERKGIRAT